jgi:alpha-1,2-mannosyltransferase
MFSSFALAAILIPGLISVARFYALGNFYHAPFDIAYHFEYITIPSILSDMGFSPVPPPKNFVVKEGEVIVHEWDYTPLARMEPRLNLCYGNEWHRFPSSFLVPEGIEVQWIKSGMDGMMPRKWEKSAVEKRGSWPRKETRVTRPGRFNGLNKASNESGTFVSQTKPSHVESPRAGGEADPIMCRSHSWKY